MQLQDRPVEEAAPPLDAHDARPLAAHRIYRFGLAYGRLVYRFRWFVLAFWVLVLAVSVPFAAQLPALLTGGGFNFSGAQSTQVSDILQTRLHASPSQLLVVFQSSGVPTSDPSYSNEVGTFERQVLTFPHVTSAQYGGVGADGTTSYVVVNFNQSGDAVQKQVDAFRAQLPTTGPARTYLTGDGAVYQEFTTLTSQDTEHAELVALPILLVVLVIVFGTLSSAITPLLLALAAVPVTLALLYPIASHSSTSIFVLNIATAIGFGIAIDYSLFMVRRFRDELARGRTVPDAIGWTLATAGEAIFFSGLTVMIGFFGMLLMGVGFMTSIGIGGALIVGTAALGALTLLPAWLSVLGQRINALHVPLLSRISMRASQQSESGNGYWHRLALGVMRRPILTIVLVAAVLVAFGWPVLSIQLGTPSATSLPASSEARQGLQILAQQFPGFNQQTIVVAVQTKDGSPILTAGHLAQVQALSQWVAGQAHVASVTSLTTAPAATGQPALTAAQLTQLYTSGAYQQTPALAQLVAGTTNGDVTIITARSDTTLDSAAGKQTVIDLRQGDPAASQGLTVLVGGFQAVSMDFNSFLYGNFPKAILFILLATYVLLLLMFRSAILPLKAIVMNILSVSAAYGALVFVFQFGHFQNILNFTSEGFLESTIPILLFCILFGLSMDYEVFLLSRIREEWLRTGNNTGAVALGLEKTGGVITSAALLFIIVTGALTFSRISSTQEAGLGMTVAVLVDAAIIRTLLVPATMRLLGRWNWWLPGRPLPPRQA